MRRVLVTRPEPGASETAPELVAAGFEPVLLPLTKIEPLQTGILPQEEFGAVAVTSANAVRHATPALLQRIAHLPAYAVGEATGRAAGAAGLSVRDSQAGDAEHLAERITGTLEPGTRVLLLCGRVRRDTLERSLALAGLPVTIVETYDTIRVPLPAGVEETLGERPIDVVLVYSAVAAEVLNSLERRFAASFRQAAYIAISDRVAEKLPARHANAVHVAPEPTQEAMLTILKRLSGRQPFFRPDV
ncbi:uroporphyrinogen-III synthase [Chelativorans sp. AA-79]|uniref:uroporphyrinogen-III synthase n=1 Tax=Chelativorans sp. AA-79 TaxID=3028735 RepID=UPI0023F65D36|nr:uroporphyrinogen-III synthase [Chelativorans sp. AA-79]WEX09967.1 uroporphyrinogen-III synthase [Chelativorans sp. AA-79]